LGETAKEFGDSVMLVGYKDQTGLEETYARAGKSLAEAGLKVTEFFESPPDPEAELAMEGARLATDAGVDVVVGLGGGSPIDAAKGIAALVKMGGQLWDYAGANEQFCPVTDSLPLVAVPTTSGTGSEVGRASVITDVSDQTKKIIFHPKMLPSIVVADPELTLGLPPQVTAAVGMDALSHNLEAFCSPGYHPMAQGIALEGIKLIHRWLPVVYRDGASLEGRAQMMAASAMGATAFQKGLGAMHSLSHPVTAVLGAHHGLTNAVVMPYVLRFNRDAIAARAEELARYLDLPEISFSGVLDWVVSLRRELEIPETLSDLGVTEEMIDRLAPMAAADPSTASNPLPCTAEDMADLYRRCIRGELVRDAG
jgi:alcohol dehydrogenase class IV